MIIPIEISISSMLIIYFVASVFTAILFVTDKQLAISQRSRISEKNLILASFFFGWPGAIAAMKLVRHKTQKITFQLMFGLSIIANVVLIIYLISQKILVLQ